MYSVPRGQKREQRSDGDGWSRQRKRDANEGIEARAAIDQHGFFSSRGRLSKAPLSMKTQNGTAVVA